MACRRATPGFPTEVSPIPRSTAPNSTASSSGRPGNISALADELPEPGDYKTTFLGETPVIVTRGEDGEIHAMVNRCAHRGNLVCLKRRGHTETG